MSCNRIYDAIGPFMYLDENGSVSKGFCHETCMDRYMRLHRIPTKLVACEDVSSLKSSGWHDLADWVATGGLEDMFDE